MPDMDERELARIMEERQALHTRAYWLKLLTGRLGFAETFWTGNLLPALFYGLAIFVLVMAQAFILLVALYLAIAVYQIALARALTRIPPAGPGMRGWRLAAIGWTVLQAIVALAFGWLALSGK